MQNSDQYKQMFAGVILFVLLAAFLYSTQTILSPLFLGALLIYFLSGFCNHALAKRLIVIVTLILLVYVLTNAQNLFFSVFIAFVFAYLFHPLVNLLQKWKIRRSIGVVGVMLLTLSIFIFMGMLLVPNLIWEIQELIGRVSHLPDRIVGFIENNVPQWLEIIKVDSAQLKQNLADQLPATAEQVLSNLLKGVRGVGAFFGQIFNVVLIPVLTFYLLKDFDKVQAWFLQLAPRTRRSAVAFYTWRMNRILGGYLRGQILVCTIIGLLTGFFYWLFGVPFAILLGVITGILNIIPFIGLYTSLGLAILISFFDTAPLATMLKIVIVFSGVQLSESYVVSPKILGDRVGLHPVAVIFSVLFFSKFLGFWGLIIGVPCAALIKFLLDEWKRQQQWREIKRERHGD